MFVFVRALIYSSLFIALLLIFVPAQLAGRAGLSRPTLAGPQELVGMSLAVLGGLVAVWCILTFVVLGRGTPAPFDPPRKLVVRGPYSLVRNPMYLGAGMALAGTALVYHSPAILGYLLLLAAVTQVLVIGYEEPTLTRLFGADYDTYRSRVHRWMPWPRRPGSGAT